MEFKWLHSKMVSKHREEEKDRDRRKGKEEEKRTKEEERGKEKQGKKPLIVTHRTHTET